MSPLTPSSPLFPDGVVSPLWITKHQKRLPAAFITFLPLTSDPNTSSLRDNQLKNEINSIKTVFASTNYKTKLVVVLLCDDGDDSPFDLDERLPSIRRATGLDMKSLQFLPPESSQQDIRDFATNLLLNLQSNCLEYYRDLSKHVRRKRNRGTIPPPTGPPVSGTSQVLSSQGWKVRYEFKMGIFAEFRQEMDAAGRNFDSAYEALVNSEYFESLSDWNPRFNEARMLADVIVIRTIRCLLWNGSSNLAVKSWLNHRERTRDFINRRSKGMRSYGWEAWEAVWTKTMAQLIERADLPAFKLGDGLDPQLKKASSIFVYPENTKASTLAERMHPWELLHHQGYWLRMSARHQAQRRLYAQQMPEEDRVAPGESPASKISNKAHLYDTYLALEPHDEFPIDGRKGFQYSEEITGCLQSSISHFSGRQQIRSVEAIGLQIACEFMENESWVEALCILRPMWMSLSWRQAGWWKLVDEIGWPLRECAVHAHDAETILRLDWELQNKVFPARIGWKYDLHSALRDFEPTQPKPAVVLRSDDALACIELSFIFQSTEGNVGEPLKAQLTLTSLAHADSEPIRVSEVKIVFEGSLRSIRLQSDQSVHSETVTQTEISHLNLRDSSVATDIASLQSSSAGLPSLIGLTNLTMHAGQTKVWNLTCIPREAGDVRAASITLSVDDNLFSLAYVVSPSSESNADTWWESNSGKPFVRNLGQGQDLTTARILPKPPKVLIDIPGLRSVYYTGETLSLPIKVLNDEETACTISLMVRLLDLGDSPAKLRWEDDPPEADGQEDASGYLPSRSIGEFARSESKIFPICIDDTLAADEYRLEVSANYYLATDLETPIHKSLAVNVVIVRPFEAGSDLLPRLDPAPWPDFFQLPSPPTSDTETPPPIGLQQTFALSTKVVSFAAEPLILETVKIIVTHITGFVVCTIDSPHLITAAPAPTPTPASTPTDRSAPPITPSTIQPKAPFAFSHNLRLRKMTLGDVDAATIDLSLELTWRRQSDPSIPPATPPTTTTTLPLRNYQLPFGEPRVLLTTSSSPSTSASPSPPDPSSPLQQQTRPGPRTTLLTYTLENPSLHYLTFSLTMESPTPSPVSIPAPATSSADSHSNSESPSAAPFAFSGPKHLALSLVPLSRTSVAYRVLPLESATSPGTRGGGKEIRPHLVVLDTHFRKVLRVLGGGEGVRSLSGGGGVAVRI